MLGHGQPSERAYVRARVEPPTSGDDRFGRALAQNRRAKPPELGLEIEIAHGILDAAERVCDEALEDSTVGETDADVRRVLAQRGVDGRTNAIAQRDDERVGDAGVGILRLARGTIDDRHRGAVIDAELALEAGVRGL